MLEKLICLRYYLQFVYLSLTPTHIRLDNVNIFIFARRFPFLLFLGKSLNTSPCLIRSEVPKLHRISLISLYIYEKLPSLTHTLLRPRNAQKKIDEFSTQHQYCRNVRLSVCPLMVSKLRTLYLENSIHI